MTKFFKKFRQNAQILKSRSRIFDEVSVAKI